MHVHTCVQSLLDNICALESTRQNLALPTLACNPFPSTADPLPAEQPPADRQPPAADLEVSQAPDSPQKPPALAAAAKAAALLAGGVPSPRRAGAVRLAPEGGDVDVVPSGAVDSPRRAGTPLLARSATPLGRMARAEAEDAE
jgi:hypothetical protein